MLVDAQFWPLGRAAHCLWRYPPPAMKDHISGSCSGFRCNSCPDALHPQAAFGGGTDSCRPTIPRSRLSGTGVRLGVLERFKIGWQHHEWKAFPACTHKWKCIWRGLSVPTGPREDLGKCTATRGEAHPGPQGRQEFSRGWSVRCGTAFSAVQHRLKTCATGGTRSPR